MEEAHGELPLLHEADENKALPEAALGERQFLRRSRRKTPARASPVIPRDIEDAVETVGSALPGEHAHRAALHDLRVLCQVAGKKAEIVVRPGVRRVKPSRHKSLFRLSQHDHTTPLPDLLVIRADALMAPDGICQAPSTSDVHIVYFFEVSQEGVSESHLIHIKVRGNTGASARDVDEGVDERGSALGHMQPVERPRRLLSSMGPRGPLQQMHMIMQILLLRHCCTDKSRTALSARCGFGGALLRWKHLLGRRHRSPGGNEKQDRPGDDAHREGNFSLQAKSARAQRQCCDIATDAHSAQENMRL
mmetsp:Transcript_11486/g.24090  ORF Transcript_11486/g.24090 Transcript_11486/m.24090 type:complete len:306 (-) Transcript_11486:32-949(-)